jgi:hypothetical protein
MLRMRFFLCRIRKNSWNCVLTKQISYRLFASFLTTTYKNIMDANWHSRYNQMKRRHGLTNDDVARITKLSESNVRSQVTRADNGGHGQRRFPRWLKLAIVLDEKTAKHHSST